MTLATADQRSGVSVVEPFPFVTFRAPVYNIVVRLFPR